MTEGPDRPKAIRAFYLSRPKELCHARANAMRPYPKGEPLHVDLSVILLIISIGGYMPAA